jgi:hypothetical protein
MRGYEHIIEEHTAARIAVRANRCAGRTTALARCGDRAGTGRTSVIYRRTAEASSGAGSASVADGNRRLGDR